MSRWEPERVPLEERKWEGPMCGKRPTQCPLSPLPLPLLHLSFDRSQRECDSAPEAAPGAPSRAPLARSEDLVQTPPRRGKVPLSGVLISLVGWLHLRCTSCLDSTMQCRDRLCAHNCVHRTLRLFSVPFLFLCRALAPVPSLSPQGTQLSQLRPLQATYFPQGN